MNLNYSAWIKGARERLAALEQQRQAIDMEIAALEQSIRAFEPLINAPPLGIPRPISLGDINAAYAPASNLGWLTGIPAVQSDVGLTEAVRMALKTSGLPLGPTEVRDLIVHNGFDLSGRSNAMANIHQVLRRLVNQSEVREVVETDEASRRTASGPAGSIEISHGKVRFQWIEQPHGPLPRPDFGKKE